MGVGSGTMRRTTRSEAEIIKARGVHDPFGREGRQPGCVIMSHRDSYVMLVFSDYVLVDFSVTKGDVDADNTL